MLTSITPLGERGRGQRYAVTMTAYVVGCLLGGATTGLLLGSLGALLPALPVLLLAGTVCLAAALADLRGVRIGRRQVDEDWLTRYRGWVYGAGFGYQLGLGVVTVVTSAATLAVLDRLRAMGVRIAMDDFGTGFSSLSALRNFPFDKVKIDQSFIRELAQQPGSVAIIHAVTGICASLGMTTTAEGVETEEQLALLTAEGCTEVQGYLFSRPRPAHELPDLLRAFNSGGEAAQRS